MTQELQISLERLFRDLLSTVKSMSTEQLNCIPFEGSWSAAQVAEHLSKSYNVIETLAISSAKTERPIDEKIEPLRSMFLNLEVKMKSPAFILPSVDPIDRDQLIKDITTKMNSIIEFVRSENLSLTCPAINFPGFGFLTRLEWLSFIAFHTERHLYQLKNIYNIIVNKNLKTMTHINAYLNFNGHTKEAMIFYKECLGGELVMQKISESPMAARVPSEMGAKILHSSLIKNNLVLMASDMMGNSIVKGNSISLCVNCSSDEEVNSFFTKLSNGGKIVEPLHQSFWGATFGSLTDKFGITWIFNYSKN